MNRRRNTLKLAPSLFPNCPLECPWLDQAGKVARTGVTAEAKMHEDVIHAYKTGNTEYVDRLIKKGDLSEEKAQDLKEESQKSDIERKMEHMRVEKAIEFYKGVHEKDKAEAKEKVMEKYENFLDSKASPNEKARIGNLYKKAMKEGAK